VRNTLELKTAQNMLTKLTPAASAKHLTPANTQAQHQHNCQTELKSHFNFLLTNYYETFCVVFLQILRIEGR